jgi:4-hydroxy-2-oxoheptanedioate aldolase
MRQSRVLKKLRESAIVNCVKINSSDPRITEIAAMQGFDCIWLDMEHVPSDYLILENQIRSAKLYDTDSMVRVSRGSYSNYIKPLEADAAGIMVPHIKTASEAREVVGNCRFKPVGRRPIDGGNADGKYTSVKPNDYIKTANDQRFIILQIEDPEAMDELDEIAKVEGYDMLLFGPGDFSHALGCFGQMDNPEIMEAAQKIARAAKNNGKFAGTVGGLEDWDRLVEMGFQFINIGADVVGIHQYCHDILEKFKNKCEK